MELTDTNASSDMKTSQLQNRFSLLKLAFSTPFTILMLGLSMLSFLKRQDLLSFKGFLDSLVEMFHGVTYAISQWVVWVVDWMLPWWDLKINTYQSDVIWFILVLLVPIYRINTNTVKNALERKGRTLSAFDSFLIYLSFLR